MTALYLTILFAALGEEFAYFFHDDKDWLTSAAGIDRFGRSKGGHLYDDVNAGRVGTIDEIETYVLEICGFEQGLMVQNIALATEALGLGGFPDYEAIGSPGPGHSGSGCATARSPRSSTRGSSGRF